MQGKMSSAAGVRTYAPAGKQEMKDDRKADDEATPQRPIEDGDDEPPATTESADGASVSRPDGLVCVSPLHAPTKR